MSGSYICNFCLVPLKGKNVLFLFPFPFFPSPFATGWIMDMIVGHLRQCIWGQHPSGGRATRQKESGSLTHCSCHCAPELFMSELFLREEWIFSLFLLLSFWNFARAADPISQGSENYGLQVKSGPSPVFINKVLLGQSHPHSFWCCLWLQWQGAIGTIWLTRLKIFTVWTFTARAWQPLLYPINSNVYQNINDGYLRIFYCLLMFLSFDY